MAQAYDFQYELVQYKWPRWLHQQTEKQRIIWGYKILFLDVLFPLAVNKIIFVDADQVSLNRAGGFQQMCVRSSFWSHQFRLTVILTGGGSRFVPQTTVDVIYRSYLGNNIVIPGAEICTIPRLGVKVMLVVCILECSVLFGI